MRKNKEIERTITDNIEEVYCDVCGEFIGTFNEDGCLYINNMIASECNINIRVTSNIVGYNYQCYVPSPKDLCKTCGEKLVQKINAFLEKEI